MVPLLRIIQREAIYHAVVMETVASINIKTMIINPLAQLAPHILDVHYCRKHGAFAYYRQDNK